MVARDVGRTPESRRADVRRPTLQVITTLVVQRDIQTFGFLLLRDPQADHDIND
jgi:hypothetical protein